MNTLPRILLLLLLLGFAATARADQADVSAAARGVVRVALVASDGTDAYFVGHGSGFAVAPDKVLTNAHVVELAREEKNIIIGVVPSQGRKSHGGRIIAYSPGNDLALIQLEEGRLPAATFYAGSAADGQQVVAIGYPGSVDRAQGLGLKEMVEPMMPVKTGGTISSGRSGKSFDTLLHTAPLAAGNSGGPLVDACGRVLGVNSFGSISDGNDAEFGFAVSNREVASFLRQAGVPFLRTAVPCKSMAEMDQEEARRLALEASEKAAADRTQADARAHALDRARDAAAQDVISARENAMAIAAVLLAISVLGLGAAGLHHMQGKNRHAIWYGAGGGVLLIGALAAFLLRPSFSSIEDRIALPEDMNATAAAEGYAAAGDNVCRINEARSRITVSETPDIPLNWTDGGCVNGRSQFLQSGTQWSRILIPDGEAVINLNSFDPASGIFRSDRYLADAATLDSAREIRERYKTGACGSDRAALAELGRMQSEIRAILPDRPNERLVYQCQNGTLPEK